MAKLVCVCVDIIWVCALVRKLLENAFVFVQTDLRAMSNLPSEQLPM